MDLQATEPSPEVPATLTSDSSLPLPNLRYATKKEGDTICRNEKTKSEFPENTSAKGRVKAGSHTRRNLEFRGNCVVGRAEEFSEEVNGDPMWQRTNFARKDCGIDAPWVKSTGEDRRKNGTQEEDDRGRFGNLKNELAPLP